MNQSALHALVLGSALVLSAVIVFARLSSGSGTASPPERRAAAGPAEKKTVRAAAPEVEESSLAQAERYIQQAKQLFPSQKDDKGALSQALNYLRGSQRILESLPEDDQKVKSLRRECSQLISDVNRASQF